MKHTLTRTYTLLIALFLLGAVARSQTFMKVYPTNYDKTARDIRPTADGGYMLAGYTNNATLNDCDAYIMRTNGNGDTISTRSYGGSRPDYIYGLLPTADGNFFAIGYTQSMGPGDYDIYLLKLDQSGNLIWQKNYGGSGNEEGREIIQTSDGNYMIVGHTTGGGTTSNLYLIKIDPAGNVIWSKTHGGGNDEFGNSIKECGDGGFIITGQTFSWGVGNGDVWLVRTNSTGDTLWTKTFGGTQADEGISIVTNSDGSHVFCVRDSSNGQDVDVRVIKTDDNGAVIWNKLYSGNKKDTPKSIEKTSDGGYVIGAISRSFGWINPDMWIVKLNSGGDSTWTRHYGWSDHEHCYHVREAGDGGLLAVGHSRSNSPNQKVMFLKLNSSGELAVGIHEEVAAVPVFNVYPNPSTAGNVKMDYKTTAGDAVCSISDMLGQVVYTGRIEALSEVETMTIDLSGKQSGMYFVTIQTKEFTTTKKLILK